MKGKRDRGLVKEFGKNFDESLEYVKESKNYIWAMFALFVLFVLFGFIFSENLAPYINKLLEDVLKDFQNLGWSEYIFKIFANNLEVALYSIFPPFLIIKIIFSGSLTQVVAAIIFVPFLFITGLIPVIFDAINGLTLGYVLAKTYQVAGIYQFWKILPHGIFELPAIFISLGLGLKLSLFLFARNPIREFKIMLTKTVKSFFCVVIPLLITAAIIEGTLIYLLD